MNKKAASLSTLIFVLFALSLGYTFTILKEHNIDSTNMTTTLSQSLRNATNINISVNVTEYPEMSNAINYFTNGLIRAYGEISVWIVKVVEQNPNLPYKLLMFGFILAILSPLIYPVFIIVVSLILIIKEWFANRRERNAKD
jgi:hypothetical protein